MSRRALVVAILLLTGALYVLVLFATTPIHSLPTVVVDSVPEQMPAESPSALMAEAADVAENANLFTVWASVTYVEAVPRPAVNIAVQAIPEEGKPLEVLSDDAGRFSFALDLSRHYRLTAIPPAGWMVTSSVTLPDTSDWDGFEQDLRIELSLANGTASGRVLVQDDAYWRELAHTLDEASEAAPFKDAVYRDGESSGRPLSGAIVTAVLGDAEIGTTTNGRGEFQLRGLARGHYAVHVTYPDGERAELMENRDTPAAIELDASDRMENTILLVARPDRLGLEGRVITERGMGIPGATIQISMRDERQPLDSLELSPYHGYRDFQATTADDQGRFAFEGLLPNSLRDLLSRLDMNALSGYRAIVSAEGYATIETTIPMGSQAQIAAAEAFQRLSWRQTGESGPGVSAGTLPVVDATGVTGFEIVLPAAGAIVFQVQDTQGEPIECRVTIVPDYSQISTRRMSYPPREERTAERRPYGTYAFTNLMPGPYYLKAWSGPLDTPSDFQLTSNREIIASAGPFDVRGGETIDDVVLVVNTQTGSIAGTILDARTRRPISGLCQVIGLGENAGDAGSRGEGTLPGAGVYRIDGITTGVARVKFTCEGYAPATHDIAVHADQTTSLDAMLEPAAVIRVTVTVQGAAPENLWVKGTSITDSPDPFEVQGDRYLSNEGTWDGTEMVLRDLPAGSYRVEVVAEFGQYGSLGRQLDVVTEAGRETVVEVDFAGTSGVRGSVHGTEGRGVGEVIVVPEAAYDPSLNFYQQRERIVAQARINQPGNTFATPPIEPGRYVLIIVAYDRTYSSPPVCKPWPFDAEDGKWTEATIDFAAL